MLKMSYPEDTQLLLLYEGLEIEIENKAQEMIRI
jgi:hypothetical protein